jgi:chemotaxis protein histidine kinase CheA
MMKRTANKNAPPTRVERHTDHQIIVPRNLLKAKAAVMLNGPPGLDESAIARAEKALQALSRNFGTWMEESCVQLAEARARQADDRTSAAHFDTLYRAAHDIKGQAETLGFPLAGRVAGSLCQLMDVNGHPLQLTHEEHELIGQHVEAIRAITREGITKPDHKIGHTLADELEKAAVAQLEQRQARANQSMT